MIKHILILINPTAGAESNILRTLYTHLHKHNVRADIRVTTTKEDVQRIIKETKKNNYDAIAVYGGDGTINEAIQALNSPDMPLVILPGGTANILAKELRIPENIQEAVKLITSKQVSIKKIDIGVANSIPFMLRVSTGPFADMVLQANKTLKQTIGRIAYGVSFFTELQKAKKITYTLTIDGKKNTEEGISLIVINSGNIGFTGLNFHPTLKIDDGMLDIFIIKESDIGYLTGTVKDALMDQKLSNLVHLKGKKINIKMSSKQPITCDDTKLDTDKLLINVLHKHISIVVPAK